MSIFVSEIVPEGIVFAADKNITWSYRDENGAVVADVQDLGSKILRWPKHKALLGYVGRAELAGRTMYDWLYDFMGDHIDFSEPAVVANDLRDRLQAEIGGEGMPDSVVQFATFARRDSHIVPEFWHITNIPGLDRNGYRPAEAEFYASERLLGVHLAGHVSPATVKDFLRRQADAFQPFWFHQGLEFASFNVMVDAMREAFRFLQSQGRLRPPSTLRDWESHCRMWVLTYGAYFDAFSEPGRRYVGGGADVLSIPWPEEI